MFLNLKFMWQMYIFSVKKKFEVLLFYNIFTFASKLIAMDSD